MLNKNIRGSLFISSVILSIFLVLLASSMQVEASPDAFDSVILQNGTIIGGSSTGTTGTLRVAPVTVGPRNFSIRGVYFNNTAASTWTRATLAGISGNSSCSGNKCNHTAAVRGAMGVTFTLPADVTRIHLRVEQNSTATTYANESVILTIDSAAPTFTLYPSQGFTQSNTNKTVNVTVVTNENVSSIWVFAESIKRNFSNTLDAQGAFGLTQTGDTTWKFSYVGSPGTQSFYARAYDYAVDGGNGATSALRSFGLNSGASAAARYIASQEAADQQSGKGLGTLLIAGLVGWLIYEMLKGRK